METQLSAREGRRREPWWRKTAARKQLSATLEEISAAARVRNWESGRREEGGGGSEVSESDAVIDVPQYAGMDGRGGSGV